jgi:hypothetical protein
LPKVKNYFNVLRNIDRAVDQNLHKDSELVAHLKALEDAGLAPVSNGVVSYKGSDIKIDAKNYSMGDQKAIAMCSALKLTESTKVNLS